MKLCELAMEGSMLFNDVGWEVVRVIACNKLMQLPLEGYQK